MSNVRSYTDQELIKRAKATPNFKSIPNGYWILGVRSQEDATDIFDDKFYLFQGEKFVMVTTGTTNKGLKGTAVMKSDWWHNDIYKFGLHKAKMRALRQVKGTPYFRDVNKDGRTDEKGAEYTDLIYMNFHGSTYHIGNKLVPTHIGGWSEGCQVLNNNVEYNKIIDLCEKQASVSYCLIKEF